MATERRTRRYSTYGNVAYQPEYTSSAVRAPARRAVEQPRRRPRVQPRERIAARPRVEVRAQGAVAPFAIVGFAAVALCVFFMLSALIQLVTVADETYDLQDQLEELRSEEKELLAQYELVYDLENIERQMTASGAMVKANSSNTVYLDLSEADSIIYYEQAAGGITGLVDRLEHLVSSLLS